MTGSALRLARPTLTVWRSPGVLQVGLDSPALVLAGVPDGLPRAVDLLSRPQGAEDLARLLPELDSAWVDWLVARLAAAGLMATAGVPAPAPLAVVGSGLLAEAVVAGLTATGLSVARKEAAELADAAPYVGRSPADGPVIIAGCNAEPDRTLTDALLHAGRPHLVVRLEPDRAVVGPMVLPGRSPCIRCQDLHRCRLDAAWPHLLAQLCREPVEPEPSLLAWAASTATVQVRAWLTGGSPESVGRTMELGLADFRLRSRSWPAHPRCGCLFGIG